jgi:hypothetical protein
MVSVELALVRIIHTRHFREMATHFSDLHDLFKQLGQKIAAKDADGVGLTLLALRDGVSDILKSIESTQKALQTPLPALARKQYRWTPEERWLISRSYRYLAIFYPEETSFAFGKNDNITLLEPPLVFDGPSNFTFSAVRYNILYLEVLGDAVQGIPAKLHELKKAVNRCYNRLGG